MSQTAKLDDFDQAMRTIEQTLDQIEEAPNLEKPQTPSER